MLWRVGVSGSNDSAHVGNEFGSLILTVSEGVETSHSFSIETEVLGEGLAEEELDVLLHEVSNGESILMEISSSESLVGRIEQDQMTIVLDSGRDSLPLGFGWVASGWVMSARVEKEDGSWWGSIDRINKGIDV